MDGMNNQGNPEQNPNPNPDPNLNQYPGQDPNQYTEQPSGQNINQGNNSEAGNTYWEAGNAGQNPTPEAPAQETPQQFYQYYQQQMGGEAYNGQQMPGMQYMEPPKKKSHKGLVAAIIVIAVLLGLGGTAFAFKGKILNALSLSTKNPAEYYATVEKNAINNGIDKLKSSMGTTEAAKDLAYDLSMNLSYDKATVDSLLQSTLGMTITDLESQIGIPLDSIGLNGTVALKDSQLYEKLGVKLNKTDIITMELFIDSLKKEMLMRFPELSPAYLKQSLDTGSTGFNFDFNKLRAYFTAEKLADFTKRYSNLIIDQLKNVELSKNEELTTQNTTIKCNKLTVTIDKETMQNIITKVLDEAKDDKFIIDMLPMFGITKEQYQSSIDQAASEVETTYASLTDSGQIVMVVYVDGDGRILGRDFSISENGSTIGNAGYYLVGKNNEEDYKLYVQDSLGTEVFSVIGSQTKTNGAYTGKATVTVNGASIGLGTDFNLELSYDDVKAEVKDGLPYYYGKYSLTSILIPGGELVLNYDVEDGNQKATVSANMGGTALVTLDLTTKKLTDFTIPTPSSSDQVFDTADSASWTATFDVEKYISDLSSKLGVDVNSLISNLEGYFAPAY